MQNALATIQLLVAPVVMISACGLLCLALYNRLATIVSRARAFHKERFDAMARLAAEPEESVAAQYRRRRVALLDEQVDHILSRGVMVRNALVLLLLTVCCMLACSLVLGLSIFIAPFAKLALTLFVLGIAAALGAIAYALAELRHALDPVQLEATALDDQENPSL